MPLDPGDNMKAAEDFLEVVLQGYIAAAAETICDSSSTQLNLDGLAKGIVQKFVQITLPTPSNDKVNKSQDKVCLYTTEVLTLRLLWENFHDATREGDGEQLSRIWKFLLLIFKAASV